MSNTFVFTEMIGCAKIGRIALESYLRHHEHPVHVFISGLSDLEELGEIVDHVRVIPLPLPSLIPDYKKGHQGTAKIFSLVCKDLAANKRILHFDSDIYFKQESLSVVERSFDEGYDIIGTRRCYGNNPGRVPNLECFPDTVSTYFMGLNLEKLPNFDIDTLSKMWQGAFHPLYWPILDFGDAVIHAMLHGGAKMKFLDWNEYGSQNSEGKKTNNYELNLHLDCGSKLLHLGGVGSGYSYFNKQSNPEKSYGEWALGRYALFAKVFYNEDIGYDSPTIYGSDGRWINGNYDDHILELVKKEIQ